MPRLKDAVLAHGAQIDSNGVRGMVEPIDDREEFVRPIPSEFPLTLGFMFEAKPDSVFGIETEVKSHMDQPLWYDSGSIQTPDNGNGEFFVLIPVPVRDVGPCTISLYFDKAKVWSQRIFFARA